MWVEEQVRSLRPQAHRVLVTTQMPCGPCTIYQGLGRVPGWTRVEPSFPPHTAERLRDKQHGCACLGNPCTKRTPVSLRGACESEEAWACSQVKERLTNHPPGRKVDSYPDPGRGKTLFWTVGCPLSSSFGFAPYCSAGPLTQGNLKASLLLLSGLIFHW